jgi:transcriptional regulator with XRE-family HTH domain
MSYLSIALQRISESHRITRTEVARASGISQSYMSRLFTGEFQGLSDQNFNSLLKSFGADTAAQAELVAARCKDIKAGAAGIPGADLVDITIKPHVPGTKPAPALVDVPLSQETERAFAWLRAQCPLNPDLEKHLISYAKLMGMK